MNKKIYFKTKTSFYNHLKQRKKAYSDATGNTIRYKLFEDMLYLLNFDKAFVRSHFNFKDNYLIRDLKPYYFKK